MAEVAVILLAAGLSRRMGAQNKLLLSVAGTPMIRHMVQVYAQVASHPVTVVTGHEADKIDAALAGSAAQTVHNRDFAQGQAGSVACGLRAAPRAQTLLIALGDQPHLTPDDLRHLLAAHQAHGGARITIPQHDGQRGNPIVVPDAMRAQLLANPKSPGCKTFTRSHPDQVCFVDLPAAGFYADVDTPEAYAALTQPVSEAPV